MKKSNLIVDDVLTAIRRGELLPGATLATETDLRARYDCSRTIVREAIHTLVAIGFVFVRQGRGAVVAPHSAWSVTDARYLLAGQPDESLRAHLDEVRYLLEPAIAALAAQRISEVQLRTLRDSLKHHRGGGRRGRAEHGRMSFHALLAQCTGNPVLMSVHGSLTRLMLELTPSQSSPPVHFHDSNWHGEILDAIADGDSGAAHDAMRMHLRQEAEHV